MSSPEGSEPRRASGHDRTRWVAASLPLAPLAAVLYLFCEWLFMVTKPSPTGALPLNTQLLVLLKSPMPVLLPLIAAQAVASLASLAAYPRFRGIAFLPAAGVCGFLLLVLIDNFTYTIFTFGMVRSGEALRIAYTMLLALLTGFAGWKLHAWFTPIFGSRGMVIAALGLTAVFLAAPPIAADRRLPQYPDATVLPELGATTTRSDRPNILFLGADGLDASILSAYGYGRGTTPFLESIRADTLFFENAFSNAARTHGSLVTLLTGRLPFSTHVTFPPTLLQGDDAHRTLPMVLKGLGYTTLQIGMRHYADAEDTNVMGFDAANYRWQRLEEIRADRPPADETDLFRAAVAERIDERLGRLFGVAPAADTFAHVEGREVVPLWRDERRVTTLVEYFSRAPQPWFVHLHLLDTHCCQWVPDRQHFSGGRSAAIDARDSQVRETDGNIRKLFEALESTGQLDRTIVVISSDHASDWKIIERVPLMIRFPDRQLTGRVAANAQLADIAPTMLSYLKVGVPAWMDGRSLLPAAEAAPDRPIFGVSDVKQRVGPSGLRFLLDSGPPNYGVAVAMMVIGDQWFELSLLTGKLISGHVSGHSSRGSSSISDAEARRMLLDQLRSTGFEIEHDEAQSAAALPRDR